MVILTHERLHVGLPPHVQPTCIMNTVILTHVKPTCKWRWSWEEVYALNFLKYQLRSPLGEGIVDGIYISRSVLAPELTCSWPFKKSKKIINYF